MSENEKEVAKKACARAACELIEDDTLIGLGTGTTATHFINFLAKRYHQGLKIQAVASSNRSYALAKKLGIPLIDINTLCSVDITVDGADEIDRNLCLIKGGGGAAFREKIVANMSKKFIVIADESKIADYLGHFPLAVEILPFGHRKTLQSLEKLGYKADLRKTTDGKVFVTDNGNFTCDITLSYPCTSPSKEHEKIKSIVGVIETGFFLSMADICLIGLYNGQVRRLDAKV